MNHSKRLLVILMIAGTLFFLQLPNMPPVIGSIEKVTWKTFKDNAGLFTIEYPSKWIPTNVSDPIGSIDVQFRYDQNDSFAYVEFYASPNSVHHTSREMIEDEQAGIQTSMNANNIDFRFDQGAECEKYLIDEARACSLEYSFSYPDENRGRHLLVANAVDNTTGIEYSFVLTGTDDIFATFKPVFDHMVDSFRLTAVPGTSLIPSG